MDVTISDPALAVLLRQVQWLLDDVAHDLPAGKLSAAKQCELADILERLAALLRVAGTQTAVGGESGGELLLPPGEHPNT